MWQNENGTKCPFYVTFIHSGGFRKGHIRPVHPLLKPKYTFCPFFFQMLDVTRKNWGFKKKYVVFFFTPSRPLGAISATVMTGKKFWPWIKKKLGKNTILPTRPVSSGMIRTRNLEIRTSRPYRLSYDASPLSTFSNLDFGWIFFLSFAPPPPRACFRRPSWPEKFSPWIWVEFFFPSRKNVGLKKKILFTSLAHWARFRGPSWPGKKLILDKKNRMEKKFNISHPPRYLG